jgi:hypothetical protein
MTNRQPSGEKLGEMAKAMPNCENFAIQVTAIPSPTLVKRARMTKVKGISRVRISISGTTIGG